MKTLLGYDSTNQWTPKQYCIDAGWDYSCIEATAQLGLSEADAEELTNYQQKQLLDYCHWLIAEQWSKDRP